jgi:hypothetical protein
LPLLIEDILQPRTLESPPGTPFASLDSSEAFFHPFAVTTVLHLSLRGPESRLAEGQEANVLDSLLRHPLGRELPGQVRDGAPLSLLPFPAVRDADGNSASFEVASHFVSLSALHQAADPQPLAYRLASLYRKTAADKSRPLNTDQSAISVTEQNIGMLLPQEPNSRVGCLHHNITTLLAYMENLAAVVPSRTTTACDWFLREAALILNHLYRREPLPDLGIYKSRLAEMRIDHRGLAPAINRINRINPQVQPPPPSLPEGATR